MNSRPIEIRQSTNYSHEKINRVLSALVQSENTKNEEKDGTQFSAGFVRNQPKKGKKRGLIFNWFENKLRIDGRLHKSKSKFSSFFFSFLVCETISKKKKTICSNNIFFSFRTAFLKYKRNEPGSEWLHNARIKTTTAKKKIIIKTKNLN